MTFLTFNLAHGNNKRKIKTCLIESQAGNVLILLDFTAVKREKFAKVEQSTLKLRLLF